MLTPEQARDRARAILNEAALGIDPVNAEALTVLTGWQTQAGEHTGRVFPGQHGGQLSNVKSAWRTLLKAAGIGNFRWHDLRHHFASRLVMAGVDLNTVRELLGHSDIKMTRRYAQLAPEHRPQPSPGW